MKHVINLLFCSILCAFTGHSLHAQTTQASIYGVVSDESKQLIPGASVQVRNESTGFTSRTVTNAKGEYTFRELPLGGPYTVTITSVGYAEQKQTGYALNQGDVLRVDRKSVV